MDDDGCSKFDVGDSGDGVGTTAITDTVVAVVVRMVAAAVVLMIGCNKRQQ